MICVREFRDGDAESVAALMLKAFQSFLGARARAEDFTAGVYKNTSKMRDARAETLSFVAADGGRIAGYLKVVAGVNGLGALDVIGVDPEYFSKGVGSMLFDEAEKFWRAKNQRKISTCVSAHNKKAIIYYLKHDFIPEGYRRDHFFEGVDEIILGRFMKKA
jgi:ribosomal protein S18 acetylase RimI-like enzyme